MILGLSFRTEQPAAGSFRDLFAGVGTPPGARNVLAQRSQRQESDPALAGLTKDERRFATRGQGHLGAGLRCQVVQPDGRRIVGKLECG